MYHPIPAANFLLIIAKKLNKHAQMSHFLSKCAILLHKSQNVYDLFTFVAKFCRRDLRTFSADFFETEK